MFFIIDHFTNRNVACCFNGADIPGIPPGLQKLGNERLRIIQYNTDHVVDYGEDSLSVSVGDPGNANPLTWIDFKTGHVFQIANTRLVRFYQDRMASLQSERDTLIQKEDIVIEAKNEIERLLFRKIRAIREADKEEDPVSAIAKVEEEFRKPMSDAKEKYQEALKLAKVIVNENRKNLDVNVMQFDQNGESLGTLKQQRDRKFKKNRVGKRGKKPKDSEEWTESEEAAEQESQGNRRKRGVKNWTLVPMVMRSFDEDIEHYRKLLQKEKVQIQRLMVRIALQYDIFLCPKYIATGRMKILSFGETWQKIHRAKELRGGYFEEINEDNSTILCPLCGCHSPPGFKRKFHCSHCGFSDGRDPKSTLVLAIDKLSRSEQGIIEQLPLAIRSIGQGAGSDVLAVSLYFNICLVRKKIILVLLIFCIP